jgi:hypothetical protein
MTQNELLPIGTQLITKRLAIAAQLIERFTEKDMQYFDPLQEIWVNGFETSVECEYNGIATVEKWCIIVTADNQALLSDVVIVDDYTIIGNETHKDIFGKVSYRYSSGAFEIITGSNKLVCVSPDFLEIIKRYYPHADATLQAITEKDFCEVVKPKGE